MTLFAFVLAGLLAAQQATAPASPAASADAVSVSQSASQPASPQNQSVPGQVSPEHSPQPPDHESGAQADSPLPPGTPITLPKSPKAAAEAKRLFQAGVKLKESGQLELAFQKFDQATDLDPRNASYLTAREFARQELVQRAMQQGNQAILDHNQTAAVADFRQALEYDPGNDFALQRLREATPDQQEPSSSAFRVVEKSTPIELQPSPAQHDFHYRGDARTLLTQVAQAYGITAQFDDSVQQRRVHFDIDHVNCATALEAATAVTKTFWVPLSSKQILFAADNIENRRLLERMSLRTFYLPELTTDRELTEMTNSLRVLLNLRFIALDKAQSTITIRAEEPLVEAASRVLESLSGGAPQVMLDMRVYQISSSLLRQIGTNLPTQFTLFNISPSLIASLGQNAQNAINQLIASGGINAANSTAISALLAQLQSQSNSILSQPFATFGGGLTLFGLTTGGNGLTFTLNLNESDIRSLDHVTLRAAQNDPAVLKVGERYPIVNATFAPIYNSAAISQVIGNQTYIAPVPSVNYEDLGLVLKATPIIHEDKAVTLKLEMQIRSLGATTVNGIPIINNRQYSGSITLNNGEAGVVSGLLSENDSRSLMGYPFLSRVPGVTYAASQHNKNVMDDELLVVITPHTVRLPERHSFAMQIPSGH